MPKAHAAQIDHVPALAMQFSNDCNQIADVVESMAQTSNWDPPDSVARLRELSEIAYEKQMVSPLAAQKRQCLTLLTDRVCVLATVHSTTGDSGRRRDG